MLPEEAQFLNDLRMKVISNLQQKLPAHTGLEKRDVKKALEISRKEYTAKQAKSTASGVPGATAAPMDLNALFTDNKST